MAVISNLPGVSVQIVKNNMVPFKEYSNEDETDRLPTKAQYATDNYVEAKSNQAFKIRVQFDRNQAFGPIGTQDVGCSVYLDGVAVDDTLFETGSYHDFVIQGSHTQNNEHRMEQSFTFSALNIVEDDGRKIDASLAKKVANIGNITVTLYRVRKILLGKPRSAEAGDSTIDNTISEKALKGKAVSHSVKLGNKRAVKKVPIWDVGYLDPKDAPRASFNFKYRSLAALQTTGVIPRAPTPVPLEDRPLEELTLEETRELVRRQRAREQHLNDLKRKLKEEGSDENRGSSPTVPPKKSRIRAGPAETIDLT